MESFDAQTPAQPGGRGSPSSALSQLHPLLPTPTPQQRVASEAPSSSTLEQLYRKSLKSKLH